jgi:hypothetical protein
MNGNTNALNTDTKSTNVQHDAFKEIKLQQEILNKAIQQHPNEPKIQDALRKQKDALGTEIYNLKQHNASISNKGLADSLVNKGAKVVEHTTTTTTTNENK